MTGAQRAAAMGRWFPVGDKAQVDGTVAPASRTICINRLQLPRQGTRRRCSSGHGPSAALTRSHRERTEELPPREHDRPLEGDVQDGGTDRSVAVTTVAGSDRGSGKVFVVEGHGVAGVGVSGTAKPAAGGEPEVDSSPHPAGDARGMLCLPATDLRGGEGPCRGPFLRGGSPDVLPFDRSLRSVGSIARVSDVAIRGIA
jgi:hypothetical protein